MTYAGERRCNDADSHVMELPGWLASYADAGTAHAIGELSGDAAVVIAKQAAMEPLSEADLTPELLLRRKGWAALGASDGEGRARALDVLGFDRQLVFPTFALAQIYGSREPADFYAAIDVLNRAMADFCSHDERLLAVGFVSLRDPALAVSSLERALDLGCRAVWLPAAASGRRSPAHTVHDGFWARLAEAGVPFVNHIGGGPSNLPGPWHDNGHPIPPDHVGGGENVRAKDFPSAHHASETFLSCLILDGVLERFPSLRGGAIELAASWVPGFLRSIDHAVAQLGRNEPRLAELTMRPSDYARRQLKFTPFQFEDVGWLIETEGDELFMFSSDYPHPEGGRDPMTKFEASLDAHGIGPGARERFYASNFEEFIGASVGAPTV